jgi:hypothetical protein
MRCETGLRDFGVYENGALEALDDLQALTDPEARQSSTDKPAKLRR